VRRVFYVLLQEKRTKSLDGFYLVDFVCLFASVLCLMILFVFREAEIGLQKIREIENPINVTAVEQ